MAQFPKRESDIVVLAQTLVQGLTAQADTFPKSPYTPDEVKSRLDGYLEARDAATAMQAKAMEATVGKQDALTNLTDGMKAVLRYAESVADSEEQLAHLGWSGRRTASALEAPGQCRLLEAPRRGEGWIFLDWKEPSEGGKPSAYEVQRRELPDGNWIHAVTALESEATLVEQPRGKGLEYRVFARNKAGDGAMSNVVGVVL